MSEAKFTPGKWTIRPLPPRGIHEGCDLVGIEGDFADGHDFCAICETLTHSLIRDQEREANSRLISAAPEMFEATAPFDHIGIDEELALMPDDTMATITIGAHTFCAITLGDFKNISAALAKARGET